MLHLSPVPFFRTSGVAALLVFATVLGAAGGEPRSVSTGGHSIYFLQPAALNRAGERGVLAAATDGTVLCYTADGRRVWSARPSADFPYDLCAADLDGDGASEALIATAGGELHVLGADGIVRWSFRDDAPLFQVAVARDEHGKPTVLAGGVSQVLYAFSADGKVLGRHRTEHCIRLLRTGDVAGEGRDLAAITTTSGGLAGTLTVALIDPKDLTVRWRHSNVGSRAFNSGRRFVSLAVTDLTGDGRAELLLSNGGGENGKIFAWDHRGTPQFEQSDRRIDKIPYRMNLLMPVTLRDDRFVLGLFGNELIIYNLDGSCREVLKSRYSWANVAFDPVNRLCYLGSSVSGGDEIHVLPLDSTDWKQQFVALEPVGRLALIERNLQAMTDQARAFRRPDYQKPPRKVTVMAEPPPGRAYENIRFVRRFTWSQRYEKRDELWNRSSDRRRSYDLSADEIITRAAELEAKGQDFIVWAGHGHAVHFPLTTFSRLLDAAPRHLWGFEFAELEGVDEHMAEVVQKILRPLAEHCRARGKKILLRNKNVYWNATCYVPFLRAVLLDPKYRDVFVPALEETNCRTQELSLAGRVGLWQAGAFDSWATRVVTDEANWDRMWEWGGQQVPVHHLRHLVSRAALGSDVFMIDVHQGPFTAAVYAKLRPFYDLIERGVIAIPARDEVLSLNSTAVGMREPDADFLAHGINGHSYRFPSDTHPELVFDRLDGYWGGAPLAAHDAAGVLYGSKRRQLNFLPTGENGLVPIVPADAAHGAGHRFKRLLQTDGRYWYDEEQARVSPAAFLPTGAAAMEEGASALPVRVAGVHWSAARIDATHIRVVLVDPSYLEPRDHPAQVTLHGVKASRVSDLLTGELLQVGDDGFTVNVPAGLFSVVEITLAPR